MRGTARIWISAACTLLLVAVATGIVSVADHPAEQHHNHIEDFAFVPEEMTVNVGDAIEWDNHDGAPHTATSFDGVWDSGNLDQGESFIFTIEQTGIFEYECSIHHFEGTLIVVDPHDENRSDLDVPELSVQEGSILPGTQKEVTVTVRNRGLAISTPTTAEVVASWGDGEEPIGTIDVPHLEPGQEVTETFEWNTFGKVGDFNVTATVDVDDVVDESDEANNQARTTASVLVEGVDGRDLTD